jgi:heme exporter protein D
MSTVVDFLAMDGHGLYVWGSLGMCAAVLVAEVAMLRLRRRLLERAVNDERDDAALAAAPDRSALRRGPA